MDYKALKAIISARFTSVQDEFLPSLPINGGWGGGRETSLLLYSSTRVLVYQALLPYCWTYAAARSHPVLLLIRNMG